MTQPTKISVVIPLYNKRDYIRRSVDSVLNQSHSALEVVVIDDGSTDGSAEMLLGIKDSRLRVISQTNGGEGAARNAGARHALNQWIAYLDADDAWEPNFLATVDEMIHRYRDIDFCATGYYIKTPAKQELVGSLNSSGPEKHNCYFALAYKGKLPFCASSIAINRNALLASGGFSENEPMGADQDLWCRLLTSRPFALNRMPCATYHEDAVGRICQVQVPVGELPFSKRLQDQLDDNSLPLEMRADARRYIAAHLIYLATQHSLQHNWERAFALLADKRTRALWLKRILKLTVFRCAQLLDRLPFGAAQSGAH